MIKTHGGINDFMYLKDLDVLLDIFSQHNILVKKF